MAGCGGKTANAKIDYEIGERVSLGNVTYTILETGWKAELGEMPKVRYPESRFLVIRLAVTNGTGNEVSLPLFKLETSAGKQVSETNNGEGIQEWLGLLRRVQPAETVTGRIAFDVPIGPTKLRVVGPLDPSQNDEKYALIHIPLNLDSDPILGVPTSTIVPTPTQK